MEWHKPKPETVRYAPCGLTPPPRDYPRAADHWAAALALNPLHPEAWFSLGFCHLKAERFRDALRVRVRGRDGACRCQGSYHDGSGVLLMDGPCSEIRPRTLSNDSNMSFWQLQPVQPVSAQPPWMLTPGARHSFALVPGPTAPCPALPSRRRSETSCTLPLPSAARQAFTRCTQQEPDNGEAWNNIAALWLHLGRFK